MDLQLIPGLLVAGIFFLFGMIVQVFSLLINDKWNHQRDLGRMKESHKYKVRYLRERIFFENKLRYFEKVSKEVEKICYDYTQIITISPKGVEDIKSFFRLESKKIDNKKIQKRFKEILKNLGTEERLSFFLPEGAGIYLKGTKINSKLSEFVLHHTQILLKLADIKIKDIDTEFIKEIVANLRRGQILIDSLPEEFKF